MREALYIAIQKALVELGVPDAPFVVERPGDMSHGDYSTNAALIAAKQLEKNPREIAEMLQEKLSSEKVLGSPRSARPDHFLQKVSPSISLEGISKIEIAGPGFINFFLSHEAVASEIEKIAGGEFGEIKSDLKGQKVMVEYTDPNPFKEFHIGHLMTNTIGESIAHLFEAAGATVARANYQGDVGVHVAKAIWGKQQKPESLWGEAYVFGSERYDAHKEEVDELNKIIYEKTDAAVNALYEAGRAQSLEHFEKLYAMLGTKFDYYFFESQVGPVGLEIVKKHPEVFEESEGAVVFKGEQYGLHTRVFVNSKGLPTYEAKELGLVEAKKEKGDFALSITVTANEIQDYFKVVRKAAELVFPDLEGKMIGRFHGFLKLTTGKMSSRKGNAITGESLLMDLKDAAKEKMQGRELKDVEKTAEQIAVGAIKYAVLKQGSGKDIIFDPEKSLSLQGDSGPYLQYARVRALSIMKAAKEAGVIAGSGEEKSPVSAAGWSGNAATSDFSSPINPRVTLERTLIHFTEVVERAAAELEPHYVTTYLTELASAFNSWYMVERVVGGPNPQSALLLTEAFESVLKNGLTLLGIPAPEEM
ncbi:MAG: arginine--tRNA ligase [bacterium]